MVYSVTNEMRRVWRVALSFFYSFLNNLHTLNIFAYLVVLYIQMKRLFVRTNDAGNFSTIYGTVRIQTDRRNKRDKLKEERDWL